MTDDPWALPAAFYSIIIKTSAIDRSFPGGREQFFRRHEPAQRNGALVSLLAMSIDETEHLLAELNRKGLIPGRDVAVADMVKGPLLECPGLFFESDGENFPQRWTVNVVSQPAVEPKGSQGASLSARVLALAAADVRPPCPPGCRWVTIATRTESSMLDIWEDFLCASVSDEGVILDIRAHEYLGEVPDDWYDEDDELLAEHTDDKGDLRMPETMRDRPVIRFQNNNFFGELRSLHDRPVVLPNLSEAAVHEALDCLGWEASANPEVLAALAELTVGTYLG